MFSDVVLLHEDNVNTSPGAVPGERNVCSSEKMTQTGDGNVWSSPQQNNLQASCHFLLSLADRSQQLAFATVGMCDETGIFYCKV